MRECKPNQTITVTALLLQHVPRARHKTIHNGTDLCKPPNPGCAHTYFTTTSKSGTGRLCLVASASVHGVNATSLGTAHGAGGRQRVAQHHVVHFPHKDTTVANSLHSMDTAVRLVRGDMFQDHQGTPETTDRTKP